MFRRVLNYLSAGGGQLSIIPVNTADTIGGVYHHTERFFLAGKTTDAGCHLQGNRFFFAVFQNDIIITPDKIIPAAGQAAGGGQF